MSVDEKRRSAQRQIQMAAYELRQVADDLGRLDDVMDAGGWRRDEAAAAAQKAQDAVDKIHHARTIMVGGLPAEYVR